MMTMIVFNKQQHISMVSRQTIASVRLQLKSGTKWSFTGMWMVLTALWLVPYWVSEQQKVSLNNNTTQYLWILPSTHYPISQYQYRSNPSIKGYTLKVKWYRSSVTHLRAMGHHLPYGTDSVTCHPTQVNTCRLKPSQTGRYWIYLPLKVGRLSWLICPGHVCELYLWCYYCTNWYSELSQTKLL